MQKSTHRSSIPVHVYECSGCICIHKYGCLSASKQVMDASWCIRMHKKYGCLSANESDGCTHMYTHAQSMAVWALASKWWMHADVYACTSTAVCALAKVIDAQLYTYAYTRMAVWVLGRVVDASLCICMHTYGCLSASESARDWCKLMYTHRQVQFTRIYKYNVYACTTYSCLAQIHIQIHILGPIYFLT